MARKKQKRSVEFRYYDMPKGKLILPLLGSDWLRPYGKGFGNYHFHNYTEIGICYFGKGTTWITDEKGYDFTGGSIVVIPPNIMHTMLTEGETLAFWEWFYIDISTILREMKYLETRKLKIEDILSFLNKEALLFHINEYPKIGKIIKEIRDECEEKGFLYEQKIRTLLQEFVVELLRMKGMDDFLKKKMGGSEIGDSRIFINVVQPAIDYMEKHYFEEIKIKILADECGMSESHFRRVFTNYMNMTPNNFLNVVRVRNACKLLLDTDSTTNEIAYKTGFIDTSTFHRNFKKTVGMTPRQWKNSSKEDGNGKQYFNITALKGW